VSEGWTRREASAELIDRARHDPAAFGELYDLYADRIHAFCRVHSPSREEAEDLMAQTFERALAAIGRYQHRGVPFSGWLFRIATNLSVDRARRSPSLVHLGEHPGLEASLEAPRSDEADTWVDRWARADWLQEHVAALPPDQQRIVRLRFYEDRALAEVAIEMGRSDGAVRQLLQRAVRTLRLQMQGEEAGNA